jgi:hypothetical protein
LKYSVLIVLVLVVSIILSVYVFGAFAELSSSDKQEIKELVTDSLRQSLGDLLIKDSNKKPPITAIELEDPLRDLRLTQHDVSSNLTTVQSLASLGEQYPPLLPDIVNVKYSTNQNILNVEMSVIGFGRNETALKNEFKNITHLSGPLNYYYQILISPISNIGLHTDRTYVIPIAWSGNWSTAIFELTSTSGSETTKILPDTKKPANYFEFAGESEDGPFSTLLFSVDLNKLNLPDQYSIFFEAGIQGYDNGSRWSVDDFVGGTIIPYPEYVISTVSSVDLRPGEEKDVKVEIQSPVNLRSDVSLLSTSSGDIKTVFTPERISIPPLGTATSTLHVLFLNTTSSNTILPITAVVSFPHKVLVFSSPFKDLDLPISNITQNATLTVNTLPTEPLRLDIPWEALAGIYGLVISAIIGWSIPSIASWINETKRRRHFLHFIVTIDRENDKLNKDENQFRRYLDTVKKDLQYALGRGEITESQYDLLKSKITDYYGEK